MTNNKIVTLLKKLSIVAAAAVVLTTVGARTAAATSTVTCTPTQVQYNDAPGFKYVLVQCVGGANYAAQITPGSPCESNARTMDVLKIVQSLAEAALLSGKNLSIGYNACSNGNFIESVTLLK